MLVSALTGKYTSEKRLDIIANNLANALTPGFKEIRPVFHIASQAGENLGTSMLQNSLVNNIDTYINFAEAPFIETGNQFNFGIEGSGFFSINTKQGVMYTRNGQFKLNQEKKLVTMDGNPVLGKGGEITIDLTTEDQDLSIESDGSIYVNENFVDIIKIVDFEDKRALRQVGQSLLENTGKSPEKIPENISIRQGYLESSNVNSVKEMVQMIQAVRSYETCAKVDQYFSDINGKLNEIPKM